MRYYYMEDNGPALATEMIFSDVAVTAVSDFSGCQDILSNVTPISENNWFGTNMINWFWNMGTQGISFANVVISRISEPYGIFQIFNHLLDNHFHLCGTKVELRSRDFFRQEGDITKLENQMIE